MGFKQTYELYYMIYDIVILLTRRNQVIVKADIIVWSIKGKQEIVSNLQLL